MVIGFIGAGNMATALMVGMLRGGWPAERLLAYDVDPGRVCAMRDMGIKTADSAESLAAACDLAVLAVKPVVAPGVLAALERDGRVQNLLSIVVGHTQAGLMAALPPETGTAHAMPNTPARVGKGVIAINENHTIPHSMFDDVQRAFSMCGEVVLVPERLFDAVTAISGSGPAYVYLFIEALADAGVRQGLPRPLAYRLAAQTVSGAGEMVAQTDMHPGALKDAVCSPGGTTIEAVYALEKAGLRGAVMDAVDACARRAKAIANEQGDKHS